MLEKLTQVVLIVSSVSIASVVISQRSSGPLEPLSEGDVFPSLAVRLADGSAVQFESSKDVLTVFFSSTCPYCVASIPAYEELASERCGLDLWMVFLDIEGEEMRRWWEEHGVPGDSACADVLVGSLDGSSAEFGITLTPTHYLVGSDSRVAFRKVGQLESVQDVPQHEP